MANQYTNDLMRRDRIVVTETISRCFVCGGLATPSVFGPHKGELFMVCLACITRYDDPVSQASRFGHRFRFVERCEIPHPDALRINESIGFHPYRPFREIYKLLLLLKERQEKRKKEVMWMVDDMTQRVLKLHGRVAAAMRDTFTIRGDDATEPDDIALQKIKDLLEEIDPKTFDRKTRIRTRKKLS